MTQILGVITSDHMLLVSDRRLTVGAGPRRGDLFDDDTCKLVSLCNTCAVAYTGVAQFGTNRRPTHEWIAEALASENCNLGSAASEILVREATAALRNTGMPLTLLLGGWATFGGSPPLRSYVCEVTNCRTQDGRPLDRPSDSFVRIVEALPPNSPWLKGHFLTS